MIPAILQRIKAIAGGSLRLALGAIVFGLKGSTPRYAYQSLIQLFCLTSGKSNDLAARFFTLMYRPYSLDSPAGLLGDFSHSDISSIRNSLLENGYHVFEQRLAPDLVQRLLSFALNHACKVRSSDEAARSKEYVVPRYNREAPEGIIHDFDPDSLVNNSDIQRIMADPSFLAVAQAYIGAKPVMTGINLWWMSSFSRQPDAQAAQFYHFDMDRVRWLKFFVYLTDVGPENGPHCFVAGTHRTGGITPPLLSRGYARLTDEEVREEYEPSRFIELTGVAGTVIAEDTRGLHKGKLPTKGDRLLFQFEYSISSFGAALPNAAKVKTFYSSEFRDWVSDHPRIFERFAM